MLEKEANNYKVISYIRSSTFFFNKHKIEQNTYPSYHCSGIHGHKAQNVIVMP